jgi:cytochrome c oxidase cbb3-type subunit 2
MKHEAVEKNIGLLAFFMVIAVSVGGLTQIVPLFFQDVTNKPVEGMKPAPRWNWKAATSTSAKAATTATRR